MSVYATARYSAPQTPEHGVHWISNVDVAHEGAGRRIAAYWQEDTKIDLLVICAGYFATESFEEPHWEKEVTMYKTCAIGPVFLVHHLVHAGLLKKDSRVILVGSETGSVTLRHDSHGGGNYGGHGSKAALNMVGKLLSIDLKPKEIAVAIVHTGYLRKENKEGYFEQGEKGAVKPDEAAAGLIDWVETFDLSKTGEFWAPRGPSDIKTAEAVLGPLDRLPTPLQLPW